MGQKRPAGADVVIGIGADGSIQVPRDGINSDRGFEGSFDLHVEFMVPFMPGDHGQGRGNSGVYLPNGEEIQGLDSFGEVTYRGGGCGGLYSYKDPDTMETIESLKDKQERVFTLASFPPLAWQTYDIEYRVEKKDGRPPGSRASPSSITGSRSTTTPRSRTTPARAGSIFRTTATRSGIGTSGSLSGDLRAGRRGSRA